MLNTYSMTDIGRKRKLNQDTVYTCEHPLGNLNNLFIVCDGMGGHKAGDYASAYTVKAIEREVEVCEDKSPIKILREAITVANTEIYEKASTEADFAGMGTTCVVATICDDILYVANVGDSRLYLIDKDITQVTKDHSLVAELVRKGSLDETQAKSHPDKNIITRAVGVMDSVDADFFEVEDIHAGDTVLMCSDGLSNMLEDTEIEGIVSGQGTIEEKARRLVAAANMNGGRDNIAVILVQIEVEK